MKDHLEIDLPETEILLKIYDKSGDVSTTKSSTKKCLLKRIQQE